MILFWLQRESKHADFKEKIFFGGGGDWHTYNDLQQQVAIK